MDITTFVPDDEALERLRELSALPGAALMAAHDAVPLRCGHAQAERGDRLALELAVGTLANVVAHGVAGFSAGSGAAALAARAPGGRAARLLLGTAHAGEELSELMRLVAAVVALHFPGATRCRGVAAGSGSRVAAHCRVLNSRHSERLARALDPRAARSDRPVRVSRRCARRAVRRAARALARRGRSRTAAAARLAPLVQVAVGEKEKVHADLAEGGGRRRALKESPPSGSRRWATTTATPTTRRRRCR